MSAFAYSLHIRHIRCIRSNRFSFLHSLLHLHSALTLGCSFVPEISYNTTAHSPRIWIARISGGHNNRHATQLLFFQIAISYRKNSLARRARVNITISFENSAGTCLTIFVFYYLRCLLLYLARSRAESRCVKFTLEMVLSVFEQLFATRLRKDISRM